MSKPIIIAGPCAAESEEQIDIAIQQAGLRGVDFVRTNLWKPRTRPGFDGLGDKGLPLLERVVAAGLKPALEVITPEQALKAMRATFAKRRSGAGLLLWIGSRNQNHVVQREIAKVALRDPRVLLMVKNQPWPSEDHWLGILDHVQSAGFPAERLLNCHRGFAPGPSTDNPLGLRNVPDFQAADRIRQTSGIPMIFDPSHTGGSVPNVLEMGRQAAEYHQDGVIVEVHHDPASALTDQNQQITWDQFDELMDIMKFR